MSENSQKKQIGERDPQKIKYQNCNIKTIKTIFSMFKAIKDQGENTHRNYQTINIYHKDLKKYQVKFLVLKNF